MWLDYIEINAIRKLKITNNMLEFMILYILPYTAQEKAKKLLDQSDLKVESVILLQEAADKVAELVN